MTREKSVIEISNISKIYRLYKNNKLRLIEALHPLRKKFHTEFHALNNVSLKINMGETIGIIGSNGAGKSTLLKILSNIVTPTSGHIKINGTIAALLELGAGFNPEISGFENIYFQGAILGFNREEIHEKIKDIITFADIGDFIHQPVKLYSSGMFARLAFSIAVSVNPDILIVDEALSVGDTFFQMKCFERMKELKEKGTTILFVTHSLDSVVKICSRAIVLSEGFLIFDGTSKDAVDFFKMKHMTKNVDKSNSKQNVKTIKSLKGWCHQLEINPYHQDYGSKDIEFLDFGIFDSDNNLIKGPIYLHQKIKISFIVHAKKDSQNIIVAYSIKNIMGIELCGQNSFFEFNEYLNFSQDELKRIDSTFTISLTPGEYFLSLGIVTSSAEGIFVNHRLYDIIPITIISQSDNFGLFKHSEKFTINSLED